MTLLPRSDPDIPDFPTLLTVTIALTNPNTPGYVNAQQYVTQILTAITQGQPLPEQEKQPLPTISSERYYADVITAIIDADLIHDPRLTNTSYLKGEAVISVSVNNTGPDTIDLHQTYLHLYNKLKHFITTNQTLVITFHWETIPNLIGETTTHITASITNSSTEWTINVSPVHYQPTTKNYLHNKRISDDLEARGIFTQGYGHHTPSDPSAVADARVYRTTDPIQLIKRSQTPLIKWMRNPHASPEEKVKEPDPELNDLYQRTIKENTRGYHS